MGYYLDVILPLPLENFFTYKISEAEHQFLKPGFRVAVPFGKSKVYTAIIAKLHQNSPQTYEAKPIEQILDESPVVTRQQLQFWKWIANYYLCAQGEVMKAALPGGFLLESETLVQLNSKTELDEDGLTDQEFIIFEALQRQSSLRIQEIMQLLDRKTVLPIINSLVAKNVVVVNQEIFEQYKPKLVRYVKLEKAYSSEEKMHQLLDDLSRAPMQREVIFTWFQLNAVSQKPLQLKELSRKSGASPAIIKSLIDKNILKEYYLKEDRIQFDLEEGNKTLQLNEAQQKAYKEIEDGFAENEICLLHGITSSGKTEIYIKLIEKTLAEEKQVLYLLPEIALTSQLVSRLQDYFGEQVLVYHSKYSVNERMEVYGHVLNNHSKAKVILGARSSVFLPFHDLGLIVIDEEHETTYKQFDPAPRYNARDAAVVLAQMSNAHIVLGSATPSLESFYNATHNKYRLVSLKQRYGNVLLPDIEIVDIKEKHKKKKMTGHFSDRLLEEIKVTLEKGEQVILFQNRRGYSPILECNTCGHSPQCPNCDVSLTYHNHNNQLRCHYCGYHIAMQKNCMACGSPDLTTKGFGTEQIETEVKAIFPDHNTGRMDLDTTRGKYGYEKIITVLLNNKNLIF